MAEYTCIKACRDTIYLVNSLPGAAGVSLPSHIFYRIAPESAFVAGDAVYLETSTRPLWLAMLDTRCTIVWSVAFSAMLSCSSASADACSCRLRAFRAPVVPRKIHGPGQKRFSCVLSNGRTCAASSSSATPEVQSAEAQRSPTGTFSTKATHDMGRHTRACLLVAVHESTSPPFFVRQADR